MAAAPWQIFISSSHGTASDEQALKALMKDMKEKWGVHPIHYSHPDFPNGDGVSVLENCYRAIDPCDFVILIINSVYGTIAENTDYSYTENEYRYAISHNIPVIRLVGQRVWNDTVQYFKLPSEEQESYLMTAGDRYDDPRRLFSFVQGIAKQETGSVLFPYPDDRPMSLLAIAKERLQGLSEYVVREYVLKRQKAALDARQSSDAFSDGEEFQFIEPHYTTFSDLSGREVSKVTENAMGTKDKRVLLAGDAGCGKSTLLIYTYREAAKKRLDPSSPTTAPIPLYFSLARRGGDYRFDERGIRDLWDDACAQTKEYPSFLKISNLSFQYYFDALDEAESDIPSDHLRSLTKGVLSAPRAHSILLSTRKHLIQDLSNIGLLGDFTHRITVDGWDRTLIGDYIRRHHLGDAEKFLNAIEEIGTPGQTESDNDRVYYAPLIIKLILWNLKQDGMDAFNNMDRLTVGLLLRYTVHSVCRKELERRNIYSSKTAGAYLTKLFDFCWRLHVGSPSSLGGKEMWEQLSCSAGSSDLLPFFEHFYRLSGHRILAVHKQFEEYFLAEKALQLMKSPKRIGELSRHQNILSSDANRMIADLISVESRAQKSKILDHLKAHYLASDNHVERLLLLYMMPRLVMTESALLPPLLTFMREELKIHLEAHKDLETIAILNWLTQLEDYEAEQIYYRLLREDPEFDAVNRGVYLIYHQDLSADYGYRDVDGAEWNRTADRFREHYLSRENRQKFIRAIDLTVIRSFILNRKSVPQQILSTYGEITEEELLSKTLDAEIRESSGVRTTYIRSLIARKHLTEETAEEFRAHLLTAFRDLKTAISAYQTQEVAAAT